MLVSLKFFKKNNIRNSLKSSTNQYTSEQYHLIIIVFRIRGKGGNSADSCSSDVEDGSEVPIKIKMRRL